MGKEGKLKMIRRQSVLCGIICLGITTFNNPAYAAWQYTEWGMTPEQVAQASNGKAMLSFGESGDNIKGYNIGNVGSHKSGKYVFRSVFYFQSNKLILIKLETTSNNQCYGLANDLMGVYGKPFSQSKSAIGAIWTWQDTQKNNRVSLLSIGDDCSLDYKPLRSSNNSGL